MLQPTNRFTLFDSLRPPEGFSFDACIATTFTLDLKALLALPGIFAMQREADTVTDRPPVEILHAIRKHASQITIFAQAGEIAVPPSTKVLSFLEGSVEFPGGSNLAPKIEHHKPTLGRSAVSLGCSDLHSNHKFLDILDFSGHRALTTN